MSLSKQDFDFISTLVEERSAIQLPQGKEYLVEARLDALRRTMNISNLAELIQTVRKSRRSQLAEDVVDALTTNETSFFRDIRPFDGLKQVIIPTLMENRKSSRRLNIWCGACSSGQEPYSVLILLRENFPELQHWDLQYWATDFSPQMVQRCTDGRYADLEVKRGLSPELRDKYFDKVKDGWQIKSSFRSMLTVRRLNLMEAWKLPQMDLIMMRNVLIYFSMETKKDIFRRIRDTLAPDGYLLLGAAETTINIDNSYEVEDAGPTRCYRPLAV